MRPETPRLISNLLESVGINKKDIINYTLWINVPHLKRMKYAMESKESLDFIATGISYTEAGIDVRHFGSLRGINLALSGQDLWHGYQIAKMVFPRRKLKFCIIGVAPYSFRYDCNLSFSGSFNAYHYRTFLPDFNEDFPFDKEFIFSLLNDNFTSVYANTPMATEEERLSLCHPQNAQILGGNELCNYDSKARDASKKYHAKTVRKNFEIMNNYMELCKEYNVRPICVVFPFTKFVRDTMDESEVVNFRLLLSQICEKYSADIIDLFDEDVKDEYFFDMDHLNALGAKYVSKEIFKRLKCII